MKLQFWCGGMLENAATCTRLLRICSIHACQDNSGAKKDSNEFLSWLRRKARAEVCSSLSIGMCCYGRSLIAAGTIYKGDCIMRIPYSVLITPDKLPKEVESFLRKNASNYARLALFILAEKKLGKESSWAPYICSLFQAGMPHCTVFWSDEELEMIKGSGVYRETLHRRETIIRDFLAVQQALYHCPHIFGGVSLKDFIHAYALVGSRAWEITSKGLALIPFADFCNHDGASHAVLLSDENKCFAEVIADKDYTIGEQVSISYGKFSNATLLVDFGFTLQHNPYDQVEIFVSLSQKDPLLESKLNLLHMNNMPTLLDAHGNDTTGNTFVIKEVKSVRGRGKGIPHSLRAFVRVKCASSLRELKVMASEAASTDGRLARKPFQNKDRELQAMAMLLARIDLLIWKHVASILSLQLMECNQLKDSKLLTRRAIAQTLLKGELRVLYSASAWLKQYCSTLALTILPQHTS